MPTTKTEPDAAPVGSDASQPSVAGAVTPAPRASKAGADASPQPPATGYADLVEEELLVEEISIDGMCGVY